MDQELRWQLLRALIKDRLFLKENWQDTTVDLFPEKEEQLIASASLRFYEKYHEPIGGMIRGDTDTLASREHYSTESKKKIKAILDHILGGKLELVSVEALGDRVRALKKYKFYTSAVEEVLELENKGQLDASAFEKIVARANQELNSGKTVIADFQRDIKKRILRRMKDQVEFPKLMIDALDARINVIGRGHTGMVLAPYSSGKGLLFVHIDVAYALQGWNVLHLTLEDPLELVEDRLDTCLTGLAIGDLAEKWKVLLKRFKAKSQLLHGRIKIVDGTGSEEANTWTVAHVERVWRDLARDGFIADAIVIDYDEYMHPSRQFKGDNVKRFEFDDIYRGITNLAAKLQVAIWIGAQGTRNSDEKWIVSGRDVSEDIGKIRKVFFAVGIGSKKGFPNKNLYICRHRLDRSRFAVEIISDFDHGIFYDRRASLAHYAKEEEDIKRKAAIEARKNGTSEDGK